MAAINKPIVFRCERQWLEFLTQSGIDIPFY